jgi:hypothetical protein
VKPLAIDLFCGLGGWTDGLLAEGYHMIGFDITQHVYGEQRYPGHLVVQDVLTLHGSQFKDAALIVASPPCQEYSYMAMPWKLAKAKAAAIRADTTGAELERLNRLFNACFRIQREACAAAGRHIPMVVENVRGAIPWVGRSRWNFGSFHLWGDVPALMPMTFKASKVPGFRFDGSGGSFQTASVDHTKNNGGSWFNVAHNTTSGKGKNPVHELASGVKVASEAGRRTDPGKGARFTSRDCGIEGRAVLKEDGTPHARLMPIPVGEGRKGKGSGAAWWRENQGAYSSQSSARKQASAMIAKIPLPLAKHIGQTYWPRSLEAAE